MIWTTQAVKVTVERTGCTEHKEQEKKLEQIMPEIGISIGEIMIT